MQPFFLQQAFKQIESKPVRLERDDKVDICVVGGGFSGLWTAYYLKKTDPSLDIAILERSLCGSGASGRNGGMVGDWRIRSAALLNSFGPQEAGRLVRESETAVRTTEDFCNRHCPEAQFRRAGWAWVAWNKDQIGIWKPAIEAVKKMGIEGWRDLDRIETEELTGSRRTIAAAYRDPNEIITGMVQPAAMVLGLRRYLIGEGVRIYENTPMRSVRGGGQPRVETPLATMKADAVVLALNAWAHEISEFRRSVLPVATDVILTEPMPEKLAQVGLDNRIVAMTNARTRANYYSNTFDHRFYFARGGRSFPFAGRVGDRFNGASPIAQELKNEMIQTYPQFRGVKLADNWVGAVARTGNGLPAYGEFPGKPGVFYGHGYGGAGLGPSLIGAQILRSLALRRKDEWSTSPLVQRGTDFMPVEPLRYLAGSLIKRAADRKDRLQDEGKQIDALTRKLVGLLSSGMSPMAKPK